jgi:chitinase
VFALSFLLQYGAADQAQEWEELTASQRSSILSEYEAAGISLIVSLFGSTETPTSSGYDPIDTANTMAAWVIEYGLQGVDVDYEACCMMSGNAWQELIFLRISLHSTLVLALLSSGSATSPPSCAPSFLRANIY